VAQREVQAIGIDITVRPHTVWLLVAAHPGFLKLLDVGNFLDIFRESGWISASALLFACFPNWYVFLLVALQAVSLDNGCFSR
jgi:hypothetical protein